MQCYLVVFHLLLIVGLISDSAWATDWELKETEQSHLLVNSDKRKHPATFELDGNHCRRQILSQRLVHKGLQIIRYKDCDSGTGPMDADVYGVVYDLNKKVFLGESIWPEDNTNWKWQFQEDGSIVVPDPEGGTQTYKSEN